jgi:RimJ/RimL family protein N-acetyltransferase
MSTSTTTTASETAPVPGTGHHGQTFLVGERVYLRRAEPEDAPYSMSWRNTIFPKSTSRTESWIKDDMTKERNTATFVILRKVDDRPVGSVRTERWNHAVWVTPYAQPLIGEQGQRYVAEALGLILPWIIDELHRVIAYVPDVPADHQIVREALIALGARETIHFREKLKREGGYIDAYAYEYVNAQWVQTLGDPNDIPLERSGTGQPRPVTAPVALEADPPKNAMRVGPRVYLRPLQKADAEAVSHWSRRETEAFWDNGRFLRTTSSVAKWFESLQKETPQNWIRFAVCLRETDEFIGAVGIDGIDYRNRYAESESEIIRPEYRGGGYGSEAKHLLFDYAFNTLGLHSLQSYVIFPNTRSAAALRKQGYHERGRESWLIPVDGGYQNMIVFDLLAEEWRAMPRAGSSASEDGQR